jgi:integrase/recombinase XerD
LTRVDKGEPTRQKFIQPEDLERAVRECQDPYWITVMQFLYLTGCRGGELRNLKWADIDQKAGTLEFRRPKERKQKKLLLTEQIVKLLIRAKQYAPQESEYVFPGNKGHRLTGQVLHENIAKIGRKAGVVLGPHRLRHTRASQALQDGAPSISVQAMLGHASIRTTEEYIHLRIEDSKKALETGGVLGET